MFRGSEEHEQMLDELEKRLGENRADILREALEKYYYFKVLGQMTYFE
jgi:predicted DNA-binding protein